MHLRLSHSSANHTTTRSNSPFSPKSFLLALLLSSALILSTGAYAQTGTWSSVASNAPDFNMGVMLLMTDGTVIAHDDLGGGLGLGWDKLTPDNTGSYVNGTWSTIANMHFDRLFFASQVLPSGKVFAAGGEYGGGATRGEVYDPTTNTWTNTNAVVGGQNIYDGNSEILANGNVLVGLQNGNNPSFDNQFFNPTTNNWSNAPLAPLNHDEAAWLKLPDASILFVGIGSTNSCRYIPATNTWVADANLPVQLYDPFGFEAGAGILLPNGKAIFFGSTGHNAIYTPSGNTSPGTWAAAIDFPKVNGNLQVGTVDAPAAMMPNGRILCAASPCNSSPSDQFRAPTYFFEYDYLTNTFAQVTSVIPNCTGSDSISGLNCDFTTFLLLPTGQVLMGINQTGISNRYWIYTPVGANIAAGKPVINSIYQTACGNNYFITGKLFNGISEGAGFGDDWEMSTNYPLVKLTNGANVYWCKTSNWNRIGAVRTDSLEDTAQFTLPAALPAGTYTLNVVVNGFPSSPTIFNTYRVSAVTALSNVSCRGGSNGDAQATVLGGNLPYTYSWTNGSTSNPTGSVLSAGTYTVTVKDKLGCTVTASVTITQPATALSVTTTVTSNETCNGGSNGAANANASGGNSPYTYAWAPSGGTSSSATGLTAGTYTITLKDKNGCPVTASAIITQPAGMTVTTGSIVNVKCNGGATGSAQATVAGGLAPYTYAWTPSGGTASTATGLTAGTYTITVKDKNGCSMSASAVITQATAITVAPTFVGVSCNGGANGSANANASGGTPAYTYVWSGGGTNASKTGLSAGTYTITVTDANGCSHSATAVVTQPTAITVAPTVTNITCNGAANGVANANASGGTPAYTYTWAPSGGTSASASGLTAGTYTVTVKDNNGCTKTASAVITQPTALTLTTTVTSNESCNGGSTGAANANASGGSSPYTYAWAPSGGTSSSASAFTAGTYTVTLKDKNGCTITASAVITQPAGMTVTTGSIVNVKCNGGATGSVQATVTGGLSPYTYTWTPSGGTASTATGLTAGTYTITVKDQNGCSMSASAVITQATAITVAPTTVGVSCNGGANGSANANASGGTPAYTYVWSGGGTNASKTGLSAGTYTITVTDANGCSHSATAVITQPTAITVATAITAVTCNGGSTGKASATPSGGSSPYTYAWAPSGGTSSNATGLSAGTYTVTVKDKNGCSQTATAAVTQPTALTLTTTVTANENCNGGSNGSANANASGGISPYTYAWAPVGGTSSSAAALTAGTYTVTLKDKNGCSVTASATITQPASMTVTTAATSEVSCNGGSNGVVTATPSGGTSPYTYTWAPAGGTSSSASGLTVGTYTVTVKDKNGCSLTASATLTQPTAITIATAITQASCGASNGAATATPSGGTGAFTYSWSNADTHATATGLSAGTYTITVNDANGCTSTASATVTNTGSLSVNTSVTANEKCNGDATGSASANPSGGTAPYTYTWTPVGGTGTTASGLTAGTYTITVQDASGCIATASAIVTQPAAIVIVQGQQNTSTATTCNGMAWVTVSGGTGPFTYLWSPNGKTTDTIKSLCDGNYCCKVTDNNGCVDSTCVDVITGIPTISNASSIKIFPDPNNGYFTITGITKGQEVELYNYVGQKLSNTVAEEGTMHFDISDKPNGVYLVRILTKDGRLVTQAKLLKTN